MTEVAWTSSRSRTRTLATCGAIIAIHTVLVIACHRQGAPALVAPRDASRDFILMRPWRAVPPEKPPQALPKKTPAARAPSVRRAAPIEPATTTQETIVADQSAGVDKNWTAAAPGAPAPATDIRAMSLLLAGKADADARQGKAVPLDPVDTPFRRLQDSMAQAARGGGNSTTTTTSPTGESITLVKRGGKTRCYVPVSTSVTPSAVFDNRGSGRASEVKCPKGVQ